MEHETFKIYKTCSPSETPVVIEEKNVLLITMSCGGGIGGARWDELVIDEDNKIPSNELYRCVKAVDNKEFTINTRYVVKIEPMTMLRVINDITAHKNYTKKICNKAWTERIIVIERGQKWECVDEFNSQKDGVFATFSYQK